MYVRILCEPSRGDKKDDCINVVPFGFLKEINYKKQYDGSSDELVEAGRLSEKLGGTTVFGGVSDNLGIKKLSAFVFNGAKLVSICDMNDGDEKYSASFGYNILEICGKKTGIIVGNDVFCPDAVKALSLCGCVAIIDLYADFCENRARIAAEFYSFVYGVDFVAAGKKRSYYFASSGSGGQIKHDCFIPLSCLKNYYEYRGKRRGAPYRGNV